MNEELDILPTLVKPALGTKGFILPLMDGTFVFRVYNADKTHTDYDILHYDLEIEITDVGASLYEFKDGSTSIDYSPLDWDNAVFVEGYGENSHIFVSFKKQDPDYKALWEQMCERCDWLDKELAIYTEREPLTDDEFTTAIEVAGIPVEDVELVWAIKDLVEAAHGIKG